jgi:hypothetical protein
MKTERMIYWLKQSMFMNKLTRSTWWSLHLEGEANAKYYGEVSDNNMV